MRAGFCRRKCSMNKGGACTIAKECEYFIPHDGISTKFAEQTPTEQKEQELLYAWCEAQGIEMIHIPNERKCSAVIGAALQRQGVRKGFPDNLIPIPNKKYHSLYIELKRAKKSLSRVSPEQREWIKKLNALGHKAVICYGAKEAIKVIENYLKP